MDFGVEDWDGFTVKKEEASYGSFCLTSNYVTRNSVFPVHTAPASDGVIDSPLKASVDLNLG